MNTFARILAGFLAVGLTGCYAGSQFNIEASHLDQPVSFTSAIHNNELQVLKPGEYEDLGKFSMSFYGWSLGWPLGQHPRKDVSDALNQIVKDKGGNGITGLTIRATNTPVNFMSMFIKGFCWIGVVGGLAVLLGDHANKSDGAAIIGASVAGILLLPTLADFTIEGTLVKIRQKEPM